MQISTNNAHAMGAPSTPILGTSLIGSSAASAFTALAAAAGVAGGHTPSHRGLATAVDGAGSSSTTAHTPLLNVTATSSVNGGFN
jgi:hypothetical protein